MYKAIRISGADGVDFLQGQLTQDVARLEHTVSLPAAWCNPKGRVIVTMRLVRQPDAAIYLVVPTSMLDAVVKRLTMYRLRSNVQIEPVESGWIAMATSDDSDFVQLKKQKLLPGAQINDCAFGDSLVAVSIGQNDCVELYGSTAALEQTGLTTATALTDEQWAAARVDAGLPDIDIRNTEKFTPHMLNFDKTGAISFEKGCYTGQEVVARTEHLGKSKRRLMQYRYSSDAPLVGDAVSDGDRDVGTVVNVGAGALLAVTPVAVHQQVLFVNGSTIEPAGLSYL